MVLRAVPLLQMITAHLRGVLVLRTLLLQAVTSPDIYGATRVPDSEGGNAGGVVTHHSELAEIGETPGDVVQLVRPQVHLFVLLFFFTSSPQLMIDANPWFSDE